ncbi:uncharacterized protein LOC131032466 [Cryptomeria japonica]|uniref:uncharacterized protein LOC131032466 n=1 Tax=Cryptomeria japonica TaxID=3369 RepID=UPI0025AC7334|nr:uncharacterized protein LOC131032466 [Cryptomeria japonica]
MDPEELRMIRILKVVKGDSGSMAKVEVPMYGGKRDSEEFQAWIDALVNFFEFEEVEDIKKAWVEFNKGPYKDKVLCDIIPMDVCHLLLGKPWQFDRRAQHDGHKNIYAIEKDGVSYTLEPLQQDMGATHEGPSVMVVKEKEFLKDLEEERCGYDIIANPIYNTATSDKEEVPNEVQGLLDKYENIVVEELPNALPPARDVSQHIDLIPGASLSNKVAYKMAPQQNEEIKN